MICATSLRRAFGICCLVAWVGAGAAAVPTTAGDADAAVQEFKTAMVRVRQHLPDAPDSDALQSFVIYDYLVAARLRRDLSVHASDDLDARIDTFLRRHAGQPVARGLNHDWLASLAAREKWSWFLPRSIDVADAQLACERLTGLLATGQTDGLGAQALLRFSVPQRQPAECDRIFGWLRSTALLTPAVVESRTRAALAADNPRAAAEFIGDVPPPYAAPLQQWLQLLNSPAAPLAMLAENPAAPVEPDALVAGLGRYSVGAPEAAATLLPGLLRRTAAEDILRLRLQRAVALGAAYSRSPVGVAVFSRFTPDPADTQALEWRVRAALWAGDFARVEQWTGAMPPTLATQPRWRYWHARAVEATSGSALAAPLYAEIAGMRDFYGYLAADRLGRAYNLNIQRSPDDPAMQAALAAEPGLIRAHALFDCDLADEAGIEWAAVVGQAKAAVKIQAARLASQWGWYAQTIATLAQTGDWDDVPLRYPRPYAAIVAAASEETRVPIDWIYAVMRQESLFRKDAVSRADARGLMQMQPGTAAAVAHRWHSQVPARDGLFDPAVAVKLGAEYLRELLDRYHGQLDQALAAYNAGPVSVARWTPADPLDADIWIENIPYTETRMYVQHNLEHIVAFSAVRQAEPPRLASLLPKVGPYVPPAP